MPSPATLTSCLIRHFQSPHPGRTWRTPWRKEAGTTVTAVVPASCVRIQLYLFFFDADLFDHRHRKRPVPCIRSGCRHICNRIQHFKTGNHLSKCRISAVQLCRILMYDPAVSYASSRAIEIAPRMCRIGFGIPFSSNSPLICQSLSVMISLSGEPP